MKKLAVAILAMTLALIGTPAMAADDLDRTTVDSYVNDYLDRNGLPGASIAVVKDGEVVQEAGYGEDSDGKPITDDTRMRIASVSKSFTAFAVLQLVDAGKVELDEPVVFYLPEFRVDDKRGKDITVRHLLAHTSGIPSPVIVPPATTSAQSIARTHDWKLASRPGTKYSYGNPNYWIAARLVEVVSGEAFNDYLEKRVFGPLGMDSTLSVDLSTTKVDGLADGHITAWGRAFPRGELEAFDAGAGSIVSTAHDMALWLGMQQRKGKTSDGKQVLSAELIEESYESRSGNSRYGLGWYRGKSSGGSTKYSHSGNLSGFSAQQDLLPESGLGVVVLLNSFTTTYEHPYAISEGITDLSEGRGVNIGPAVPTFVDLGLGVLTLLTVLLGLRGALRSRMWAVARAQHPLWRKALRMLPQLIAPALAVFLFLVLPSLQGNSSTPIDAYALWPAATTLLLALAVVGITLTVTRIWRLMHRMWS